MASMRSSAVEEWVDVALIAELLSRVGATLPSPVGASCMVSVGAWVCSITSGLGAAGDGNPEMGQLNRLRLTGCVRYR